MYLDGFGKFLKSFIQKCLFALVIKMLGQKNLFLAKNQAIEIDFLWNSLSKNPYFYVFHFSSFSSYGPPPKKYYQNCEGGTVLICFDTILNELHCEI